MLKNQLNKYANKTKQKQQKKKKEERKGTISRIRTPHLRLDATSPYHYTT